MATKITIPVDFRATSNSMKEILQQFQQGMSQVDLSTTLGKKLKKTLDALKEDLSGFEEIAISPTVDRSGLAKAERLFEDFVKKVKSGGAAVEGANVFEFNLSKNELDILAQYSDKIKDLGRQLDRLKKSGSNRSAESYLTEIGQGGLLTLARNTGKSFKGQSTLGTNASAMEKEAAATRDSLERLQANQQSLLTEATALQQSQRALQTQLKTATKQRNASQAIVQKGDFLAKFQGLDYKTLHTKSGALRGQTAVLNEFMTAFEAGSIGGRISDANRSGAESVLKYLGFDATQISQLITQQISQIRRAIAAQLEIQDGSNDMLSGEAYQRIQNVQRRSQQYLTQYATSARYQQYEQEKNAVVDLTEQVTSAQNKIADNATEQAAIGEEIAKHQQLVTSLTSVITSLQRFQRQLDQSEIDELNEELEEQIQALADAKSNIIANKGSGIVKTRQKLGPSQDTYTGEATENLGRWEAENESAREAEQFTANLKQSIKQWMSAQQIINMVKDGIRQAYQDIQSLDKAMTNIAVVTDMSVGDLWGKINEYMSIAQQYGVSTQGVYEVSQLYYQQGLGTADVMAATTETLKMARIAGMDYAEAADAMTVAIRSFKMEMSDAAHVTDVYSKVAAVTASDSEELAIAMSKTASSAESVGSSFENTTAMLAVMIETTRESAQNLGSALKSIISRYGEMKVGATVDAEGEALDYNKVDTALKSVGISIKDAQGQFRDFDEVIFELSEKWDSLDSVTQRYIATIMAGNRQQSRFIALVDNWERLDEVAGAAQDSEDAGLLQYAKTLDSLETKITNIKTSFQEFYMSLVNGPIVGAALEGINNILKGFNKLGNWQAILNIAGFIRSIKSIAKLLVSAISPSFSSIVADFKSSMQEMVEVARQKGYEAGKGYSENFNAGTNGQSAPASGSGSTPTQQSWLSARMIGDKSGKTSWSSNSWNGSKMAGRVQIGGQLIGAAASIVGSSVAKDNQRAGAVISGVGNIAQGASMGAALGPWGAVIGGVIGGLASLPAVLDAFDPASVLKEKLEKAEEALSEANIERAQTKDTYTRLDTYLKKLQNLEATRFDSAESYEEWANLNAEVLEAFPELASTFDEANNAIVDLNRAEQSLTEARLEATKAAKDAADKQIAAALAREETAEHALSNAEAKKIISATNSNFQYQTSGVFAPEEWEGLYKAIPAEVLYQGDYAEATRQAKNANRRAFVYEEDGLISYEFATAELAKAFSYIDVTNQKAIKWYMELAEITDPDEFYNKLAVFDSSYLMSDEFGTAEEEFILSLFQSDVEGEEYANVTTVAQLVKAARGELFTKERNAFQSEQAVTNAVQSGIAAYISSQFLGSNAEETYIGLAGVNSNFQNYLVDKFNSYSEEQLKKNPKLDISQLWENWTIAEFGQEFTNLDTYYKNFYSQLKTNGQIDDYNAFIASADSYNLGEFEKLIAQFGLTKDSDLGKILYDQFEAKYNAAEATFVDSLKNISFAEDGEGSTAAEFFEKKQIDIPKEYMDEVTTFARKLEDYVKDDLMDSTSAEKFWNDYLSIWDSINSFDGADEIQKAILRRLFGSADLTTPEGVAALEQAIQAEMGLEGLTTTNLIEQAKKLIPNSLINLNASYNSLVSNIATNIDAQASALSKAGDGFSNLADLQEFADKSGLDLSDFVFDDGKWYLDYTKETAEKIRESVQQNYETQKGLIEKSNQEQVELIKNANLAYKPGDITTAETLLKEERFAGEGQEGIRAIINQHWDNYVAWVKEDTANTGKTFAEYLSTYYANQLTDLDTQSADYIEWVQQELEKADRESKRQRSIDNRVEELSGSFNYQKITEAWNSIISQGLTGYSAEDIATLEHDLGIQGLGLRQADGSYDLAISKIKEAPQWVRNALLNSIQSEIESAKSAIEGLGGDIFEVTESDYSEAFSYLAEAGFQGKEIKKGINYALMEAVVGDPDQLEEYIGRELAHKMGRDYNKEFATEFGQEITASRENMVAAFKDNYIEQIKSYNDLVYKKIVGTATFEELEQLDDLAVDLNIDLGQFTGRLIDDLSTYAQSIIDNAYLSAEEKNKYLKDSFSTMLGAKGYAQLYGLDSNFLTQDAAIRLGDLSEASKTLSKTKNRMTLDQTAEVAAAYANSIGIDPKMLLSAFNFNASDNSFSYTAQFGSTAREMQLNTLWNLAESDQAIMAALKSGMGVGANQSLSIKQLLAAAADENTMAKLFEAINASNNFSAIGVLGSYKQFEMLANSVQQGNYFAEDLRVEKYASAIEQFAAGQEMSFEELVNLYSELGQEVTDPTELRNLWLQGPKAISEKLMSLAESDSLNSEQLREIQDAQERGVQTLLENIAGAVDKAINGTATLDDLFIIAKNTGVDLTGKVSRTGSGYGLNQAGMLSVAAARAQMSGDYSGEAAKLIETYAGKGGIFGNIDALNKTLEIAKDAADQAKEDLDNYKKQNKKEAEHEQEQYKRELERLEKQKELQEAEVAILQQAQKTFSHSAAKNAANFMGIDPYGGAVEDYDNYLNSWKSAQEVLKAAYGNKGVIADYKQAGQLMSFIGYGKDWSQTQFNEAYNTLFKYTTDKGTDFAAAYRDIFDLGDTLSDSEVLLEAAKLMDEAAGKMQKELSARIQANEDFADKYTRIIDSGKRVALEKDAFTEAMQKEWFEEKVDDKGKKQTAVNTDQLFKHIENVYGELGLTGKVVEDIAKTRYGEEWISKLGNVENLRSFLTSIDNLATNFKYDQSSDLSYEEQFLSYAKGEAAAQEVEERLNQLSEQIQGIVTTDKQMQPLLDGINASIQRAEYLRTLLGQLSLGTAYSTGIETDADGKQTYSGTIYTDTNLIEQKILDYKRQLGKVYGLTDNQAEAWIKEIKDEKTQEIIGLQYTPTEETGNRSSAFKYMFRPDSELGTSGVDPVSQFAIKGEFEEVEKWIEENKHIEAVYTLTTPKESIDKLTKNWQQAEDEAKLAADALEGMVSTDTGYDEMVKQADEAWAKAKTLKEELADLQTRYPTPDDGTVQLKVTGTAPESDAELIKWKEDLAKALEGAGNVSLKIVDDKGNIISDINSITKGQQITISAGLAEGTSKDTIQTLVDDVNKITGGLKGATVQIGVTGLTADTVATVTNLKTELEKLKQSPAASGVTIDISGNAATNAAEIIKNINAATNDGKPHEASLNFKVSYTVDGKAVTFDEKGLPVLPKADEDTANENANDGDKEDPGSITLTIKGVDPKSAEEAKKSIDKLGKDVQITFKQGDKEFTDVTDLADKPVEIQIQYKIDEETGEQTSEEIVKAIGEIAGEKPVNITVTGLDDTTATKVTQLATDLAGLKNPPETINIEVKDKDGKSLTLANDFATKLGAIKTDYESTVTVTVKYVDENGNPVRSDEFTPSGKKSTSNDDTASNVMHSGENAAYGEAYKKWQSEQAAKKAALQDSSSQSTAIENKESTGGASDNTQPGNGNDFNSWLAKKKQFLAEVNASVEAAEEAVASANATAESVDSTITSVEASLAAADELLVRILGEDYETKYGTTSASVEKTELQPNNLYLDDFDFVLNDDTFKYFTGSTGTLNDRYRNIFTKYSKDPEEADLAASFILDLINGFTENNTVDTFGILLNEAIQSAQAEGDNEKVEDLTAIATELSNITTEMKKVPNEETDMGRAKQLYAEYGMAINQLIAQYIGTTGKIPLDASGNLIQIDLTSFDEQIAAILADYEANPAEISVGANTINAENKAKTAVSLINGMSATLNVTAKITQIDGSGFVFFNNGNGDGEGGNGQYTGNINGLAFADGNVDSLIAGAHLANKTLVGELGPELGVWNGQYHLLGRHGAEFVNMPDDAIVFNHRQTEGVLKGQMGHRGKALADGNITGPARVNSHTINPELAFAAFGSYAEFIASLGGSGKTSYKFTDVGELEEWYNLLRKIAKLEAEINLIQAERENITDGHDYLKSLREQQAYLNEEIAVQKLLIDYKKEQLALERERIEQDEWWSKSLTFNEDGTLLSIFGNEVGGGEGVFAYLDMLNNLSGDQQVAALKKLGYSYIGKDGKALEGEELVKQFISEYQDVVGSYNELDDSILEAEATVASLTTAINDLEQEIKDNQKELEQAIYDLLVEASEREIEQTEKQNELLKEANQKYIDGLNDALSKEQQLYEQNKAIEDRESLQRQLSLLRRSGGSASEIEALEQQLDDALKSEYFDQQQKMIEDIADANERQAELLEQQVKLQQDALEYQKENGVIWTKVYEVMSGSYEEILDFFTGQDTKFFEASALAQESMLLQWAKMVGIYDEDRASKQAKKDATAHWTNGTLDAMFAEDETVSEYTNKDGTKGTKTRQEQYNELSDKDKKAAQEHYVAAYTDAILKGQTAEQARQTAYNSMVERFRMDADQGITRWDPRDKDATKGNPNGTTYQYSVPYTVYFVDGQIETGEGRGISKENARDWAEYYAKKRTASKQKKNAKGDIIYHGGAPVRNIEYGTPVKLYATGGLVDYTGVAMVHGSKSKPESFLNSDQTAQITQALRETTGKESILGSLQSTMEKLKSVIHNISTIDNSNNQSISIAPGAVVIQVEQLADSYDIEEVSRDVMNRMVAIANKATNRGVNRR